MTSKRGWAEEKEGSLPGGGGRKGRSTLCQLQRIFPHGLNQHGHCSTIDQNSSLSPFRGVKRDAGACRAVQKRRTLRTVHVAADLGGFSQKAPLVLLDEFDDIAMVTISLEPRHIGV